MTILKVKYGSMLNAPPHLHMLSGAAGNSLAASESSLLSSRGVWQNLELLTITGKIN